MGKEDEKESEDDSSGEKQQSENITVDTKSEDDKTTSTPPKAPEKTEEITKNPEELRKVIKLDSNNENTEKEEKKDEESKPEETVDDGSELDEGKTLEQKRAILQNIKDFDFQIKKNQSDITNMNKKMSSVSKDLDDLVSLYEIVSEQMNPFVGLSKVTKKRIDALENFMSDIDDLKNRVGDLESFAEQTSGNFDELKNLKESQKELLQKAREKGPGKFDKHKQSNGISEEIIEPKQSNGVSDEDIDMIIEKSFKALNLDKKIDMIIDEYVDEIKEENKNLGV